MNTRERRNTGLPRLSVKTEDLPELLGCGKAKAKEIAEQAGAKIIVGTMTLWNVNKIKNYLDRVSGNY